MTSILLTIGVWLLLLAFVIVHFEKIKGRLGGMRIHLWINRVGRLLLMTILLGLLTYFAINLGLEATRLGKEYDGDWIPILVYALGSTLAVCIAGPMLGKVKEVVLEADNTPFWHVIAGESSVRNESDRKSQWGLSIVGITTVVSFIASLGSCGRAATWSYDHRLSFIEDGGFFALAGYLGVGAVLFYLVAILGRIRALAIDLSSAGHHVIWHRIIKVTFRYSWDEAGRYAAIEALKKKH